MKKFAILFIVLLLSACQPKITGPRPTAQGGGGTDVGSAGDNPSIDHLAAWLVDTRRKARICIEIAPGFGHGEEEIATAIRKSFATWAEYLRTHRIYVSQPKEKQLVTDYTTDEHCSDETDIRFYFGVDNSAVTSAKGQFMQPVAFIQPTGARKGFIWVGTDARWEMPGRLQAALMHEIGHALGNDHVPGTIMAANIVELLDGDWDTTELTHVDHCRELSPCLGCTYSTRVDEAYLPDSWLKVRAVPKKPIYAWLTRDKTDAFTTLELRAEGVEMKLAALNLMQTGNTRAAASGAGIFKVVSGNEATQFIDTSAIRYLVSPDFNGSIVLEYNLGTCGQKKRGNSSAIKATYVSDKAPRLIGEFPFTYPW